MSLKKNILANYMGQSWATLLNFLLVPFYIQYLGKEAYGLIGVFTSLQVWVALLDMGIWPTINREMAKYKSGQTSAKEISAIFHSTEMIYFFIATLLGSALVILCPYIGTNWLNAEILSPEVVTESLRYLSLSLVLKWASNLYRGAIQGLQRQVWLNGFSSATATLRGFGALILLAYFDISVTTFFKWQFLILTIEFFGLRYKLHKTLPSNENKKTFSLAPLKPIWSFAQGTFLMNFFAATMTQTDKLVLSRILSLEEFGYYTLAGALGLALQIFANPVRSAVYPQLVGKISHVEESGFISTYRIGTQTMALSVIPVGILMAFFSNYAVMVWSGDLDLAMKSGPLAAIITSGYMLNSLVQIPASVALAHGWTRLGVLTNLSTCIAIIPLSYYAATEYGAIGGAGVWLFLNITYVFITLHFLHKKFIKTEKWKWYFRSVVIPIGVASLIAYSIKPMYPTISEDRFRLALYLVLTWIVLVFGVGMTLPEIRKKATLYCRRIFPKS